MAAQQTWRDRAGAAGSGKGGAGSCGSAGAHAGGGGGGAGARGGGAMYSEDSGEPDQTHVCSVVRRCSCDFEPGWQSKQAGWKACGALGVSRESSTRRPP